jgi:serine/threonine-protein kinase
MSPRDPSGELASQPTLRDASLSTTIASHPSASGVDVDAAWLDVAALPDRYLDDHQLGEGGMGEVRLTRDRRIGRDVAMKVLRPGHGSTGGFKARFLREARVQGQLEHPSIVPVYDIGVNDAGQAYFTMKRIRGKTLEEILDAIRGGDETITQQYSRRKLLAAFGSVCLALDFAHTRSVVHRDLKPGNIMLGDFGEVYLLDWGIAKLVGADEPESDDVAPVRTGDATHTIEGELMGTPGFMSPE